MAIKFDRLKVGMTLYDRRRQRIGTTSKTTIDEVRVRVLELSAHGAYVSWGGSEREFWPTRRLLKLYDWSMYGPDAELVRSSNTRIVKVRRRRTVASKGASK